eukprot:365082-Chlamydomonas_euryale.AAC.5
MQAGGFIWRQAGRLAGSHACSCTGRHTCRRAAMKARAARGSRLRQLGSVGFRVEVSHPKPRRLVTRLCPCIACRCEAALLPHVQSRRRAAIWAALLAPSR